MSADSGFADDLGRLLADLSATTGLPVPEVAEVGVVLQLAREVAHRHARPAAPVVAYLAGLAIGQERSPAERADRLRALVDAVVGAETPTDG